MALWRRRERLVPVEAPQSDVGAPLPHMLADDTSFVFAYLLHDRDPGWDGTTITVVSAADAEPCAIVVAEDFDSLRFGSPNDEAMRGHRLARLGIRAYSSYELLHSSWIEELEQANRVHPHHDPARFARLRHFIFTFHDTTLEFLARGYSCNLKRGRVRQLLMETFERNSLS